MIPMTPSIIFVKDVHGTVKTQKRVNLEDKKCSCAYMDQMGAMNSLRRTDEQYESFDDCYKISKYFAPPIPIELAPDEELTRDLTIKAPLAVVRGGRN